MDVSALTDWVPASVRWSGSVAEVDWCCLDGRRFTDPFFDDTIGRCFHDPFNILFRHRTSLTDLAAFAEQRPGIEPTGFIFHLSRCGSTLISRLLATSPENVVLSEPGPLDAVLRPDDPTSVPAAQRENYFRWMLSALGQRRHPEERYLFVKFDAWSMLDMARIRRVYPDVPWVFVYRDPIEVLVSHRRGAGAHMIPGHIAPDSLGMAADEPYRLPFEEFGARVLGAICRAAADHVQASQGKGLLVEYRQLPDAAWGLVPEHFGITVTAQQRQRMQEQSGFHAKTPALTFEQDTQRKQSEASESLRHAAARHVMPEYERLERLWLAATPRAGAARPQRDLSGGATPEADTVHPRERT